MCLVCSASISIMPPTSSSLLVCCRDHYVMCSANKYLHPQLLPLCITYAVLVPSVFDICCASLLCNYLPFHLACLPYYLPFLYFHFQTGSVWRMLPRAYIKFFNSNVLSVVYSINWELIELQFRYLSFAPPHCGWIFHEKRSHRILSASGSTAF